MVEIGTNRKPSGTVCDARMIIRFLKSMPGVMRAEYRSEIPKSVKPIMTM